MLRRLGICALLGLALFVGGRIVAGFLPGEPHAVEVVVPRGASDAEVARRVEEAILVEEGLRFGWVTTDPVIRGRLALNMAFLDEESEWEGRPSDDDQKVEAALALGMHRTDPIVRQRLAARVRSLLSVPSEAPDRETLEAHLAAHPERFARPTRWTLVQLPFRGDDAHARATALLARLAAERTPPAEAAHLGDVIPLLTASQRGSVALLERRFGADFARALEAAPVGAWEGPLRSAYGVHLVYVEAREGARLPAFADVEAAVRADYLASTEAARVGARVAMLRDRYDVTLLVGEGGAS